METRVAVLAIIVSDNRHTDELNDLLHEYADSIIGRMGLPYRQKGLNIITVVLDAPQDRINSLAGRIGRLDGVEVKTVTAPAASK
ncbi:MAG: iron-only hydrogenase system regulator [Ruminococcus sp.]|nr:iron-only hydrogenase system regulator [Ruminococcus sp.]